MTKKDDEILGVWSELFVGHALAVRAVEGAMAGHAPLTIDEYDVMLCISRSVDRRIRFSALAEATIYTKSGITRIVKRFEEEGFVRREECPEDKRVTYAVLTDGGARVLKETWSIYGAAIVKTLGPCFNYADAQTLRELLARLVEHLTNPALVQIGPKP